MRHGYDFPNPSAMHLSRTVDANVPIPALIAHAGTDITTDAQVLLVPVVGLGSRKDVEISRGVRPFIYILDRF